MLELGSQVIDRLVRISALFLQQIANERTAIAIQPQIQTPPPIIQRRTGKKGFPAKQPIRITFKEGTLMTNIKSIFNDGELHTVQEVKDICHLRNYSKKPTSVQSTISVLFKNQILEQPKGIGTPFRLTTKKEENATI